MPPDRHRRSSRHRRSPPRRLPEKKQILLGGGFATFGSVHPAGRRSEVRLSPGIGGNPSRRPAPDLLAEPQRGDASDTLQRVKLVRAAGLSSICAAALTACDQEQGSNVRQHLASYPYV